MDRSDLEKVTWAEFLQWLLREGQVRDIANDQRLFNFPLARLQPAKSMKMKYVLSTSKLLERLKSRFHLPCLWMMSMAYSY